MYIKFMQEYINLGHMTPANADLLLEINLDFLCNHGVLKEQGEQTKLGIIFNGYCFTSSSA